MPNLPKLTIVGAGPGDPELISLKAVKVLNSADVVLYDALIDRSLLSHASRAKHVFVGKRMGDHRYSQEEINELIVRYAREYGHVVRLKGGDPFIFGRGSEEITFASNKGLETAIVPGITSSVSVPACAGIPLTQRGVSESFWVITGTTSGRKLSDDVRLAAQSTATVVILMGMSKLNQIVQTFRTYGKEAVPVGIIQNGTTENEKSGFGRIETIEQVVAERKLAAPAIIVIGEVVSQRHMLNPILEDVERVHRNSRIFTSA